MCWHCLEIEQPRELWERFESSLAVGGLLTLLREKGISVEPWIINNSPMDDKGPWVLVWWMERWQKDVQAREDSMDQGEFHRMWNENYNQFSIPGIKIINRRDLTMLSNNFMAVVPSWWRNFPRYNKLALLPPPHSPLGVSRGDLLRFGRRNRKCTALLPSLCSWGAARLLAGIISSPLFFPTSCLRGQILSLSSGWGWVAGKLDAVLEWVY